MIYLLAGSTHTGKTALAQALLEKYRYPYLSIDHLKMGLIRTGLCPLTAEDSDDKLAVFLWPIVAEIVKTAIENEQNLIVEGCYIPFDYKKAFTEKYLDKIQFLCLIFSDSYIETHFADIKSHACRIEQRIEDGYCTKELMLRENRKNLDLCKRHGCRYRLIDTDYPTDFGL